MSAVPWVVPGAPLPNGEGWKVWYARPERDGFTPGPVRVYALQQAGAAAALASTPAAGGSEQWEPTEQDWDLFPALPGIDRRFGVLTVRLKRPTPGAVYRVTVPELGGALPFRWRSLPSAVGPEGVSFLFGSCFWREGDKGGAFASAAAQLAQTWDVAFKLLIGDQVYEDFPFQPLSAAPLKAYAGRYDACWGDARFRSMLGAAPNCFMGDDHEFWNDYPERQRHLWMTLTEGLRRQWGDAAQVLYRYYQRSANPGTERWFTIDIPPVSIFVADTRSERDAYSEFGNGQANGQTNGQANGHSGGVGAQVPHFFQDAQWRALESWAHGLRGPGVLVLGQPLYQKDGDWKDHSLSNFREDHGRLCAVVEDSLRGRNAEGRPHDILMLSGDIHCGRYTEGRIAGLDGAVVPELISSPASMILPSLGDAKPQYPPPRFTATHEGRSSTWNLNVLETDQIPTVDNNVGLVRLFPGTAGRVRFELSLWRVRPYVRGSLWRRREAGDASGGAASVGLPEQIFRHELQLR